jgi:hypothetical protein
MPKFVRKILMVDAEKVADLARRRGTSESAAVRTAVDHALAAEEIMEAIRELNRRGGVDDVFGLLNGEDQSPLEVDASQPPGDRQSTQPIQLAPTPAASQSA